MSTTRTDAAVQDWLARALADAERRGLADLAPLLDSVARAMSTLRAADWNEEAAGGATWPARSSGGPR